MGYYSWRTFVWPWNTEKNCKAAGSWNVYTAYNTIKKFDNVDLYDTLKMKWQLPYNFVTMSPNEEDCGNRETFIVSPLPIKNWSTVPLTTSEIFGAGFFTNQVVCVDPAIANY